MTPDDQDEQPSRLNDLVEQYQELVQRKVAPTIDAYVASYPELAEQLRDLLPMVVILEDAQANEKQRPIGSDSIGRGTLLGDYCLDRVIGRGGMGVQPADGFGANHCQGD